ncbi:MAG TPA: tetratricopeptide repeat protein [Vicinamibacterales bacterium]|nr:tetratricopeptide repeat protein [Vicinamibacterales bacterium]
MRSHRGVFVGVFLVVLAVATNLRAMYAPFDLENVPIDRLVDNLERQAEANPSATWRRLNLARVHAMAWASKSDTFEVRKTRVTGEIYPNFSDLPGFQGVRVKNSDDPEALRRATAHLKRAIDEYSAIVERDPSDENALLGYAWCLDQAGEKARAIAGYRRVLELVWPLEGSSRFTCCGSSLPTTTEVGAYLIPLLDPQKDATEIATIRAHMKDAHRARPVTPIVVPLRDGVPVSELVDVRARVTFDADGSGLARKWTWVTPEAGWLVFDKHGTGKITSALQWFGRVTFWLFWDNGYDALRALDDNDDGVLRGRELQGLAIWRDTNRNGVADRDEVQSLASWGIVSLSCQHIVADDDPTLVAWSPAGVTFASGRTRPTYDVLLYPR